MSSEAVVQQRTRLEHQDNVPCGQLWRNNNGAYPELKRGDDGYWYETGRHIRYGLANDSKALNGEIKSSDLIGVTPTLITPAHVGYWLGVFTAFECKPTGWTLRPGDEHAQAQARFHTLVRQACGYAGFVTDPRDIYPIIGR